MNCEHDQKLKLILASASPRRRDLLREHGYRVRIIEPPVREPEELAPDLPPENVAEALSYFKARAVAETIRDGIVIAGDTVVALGGHLFGKPVDRADARRILEALAGTTQQVITGITLLHVATGRRLISHATTDVTMKPLSTQELEAYLDTGDWEGKAGAYGIQDTADAFITDVSGSYTNVVGMPMELLMKMLSSWGVRPDQVASSDS